MYPPPTIIVVASILLTQNHCEQDKANDCAVPALGENYIPLLQQGVSGWFIEAEPNFEALNITTTDDCSTLLFNSTELFPDNYGGGQQVGREFCRVATSIAPANIALLYGPKEAAHSTARIDGFEDAIVEYCPDAGHQIKYEFHAGWSADIAAATMSPVFLKDPSLNAVIAANDDMALGALAAAHEIRPNMKLLVAGYDDNKYTEPFMDSGKMFATVDQVPPTGLAYTLSFLLSDKATGVADFGPPSSCSNEKDETCSIEDYNTIRVSAWSQLSQALPNKVSTGVALRTSDPSIQVLRELLLLYNPVVPPPPSSSAATTLYGGKVPITAAVRPFNIFDLDAAALSTSGQGLLWMSWVDSRLSWSIIDFPETSYVDIDVETIWHPVVALSNLVKSGAVQPLRNIRTTVYSNGTVVWEQSIQSSEFRCGSIDDTILVFPYDQHRCGVDVTLYGSDEATLAPSLDYPAYETFGVFLSTNDWTNGERFAKIEEFEGSSFETLFLKVEMTRDPLFIEPAMILPSFLLNMISFAQFYIPARSDTVNLDRGGLAITTILASLALRDPLVSTVDNAFTLLDVFLLISLCFHFIGFIITAYESSHKMDKGELASADKAGKLYLPVVFGVSNLILSLFWAK